MRSGKRWRAVRTEADRLQGVADVGVPVTLSQGISPSFRGWTGDLDGVPARPAHKVRVVLPRAPKIHHLAIIAGEDVHVAGLHHEHEISGGRGEPGAATSLTQGRVDLRGASEVVELREFFADKIFVGASQRRRMCLTRSPFGTPKPQWTSSPGCSPAPSLPVTFFAPDHVATLVGHA
jgi:hypothetical protein